MAARARWQWLSDLVAHAEQHSATLPPQDRGQVRPALADALSRLGYSDDGLEHGLAVVLNTTRQALLRPEPGTVGRLDPGKLATVLWALLEQPNPRLRALAETWLQCPAVAYQLPAATLEQWLSLDTRACALLRGRLPREGLAWLGPDPLRRLAASAAHPDTRQAATQWLARFA